MEITYLKQDIYHIKCTWIAPKKSTNHKKNQPLLTQKWKQSWNSYKIDTTFNPQTQSWQISQKPKDSVLQGLVALLQGLFILMFCLSQEPAWFGIRNHWPLVPQNRLLVTNNANHTYKHGTGRSKQDLSGVSIYIYINIWHIHLYTMAPQIQRIATIMSWATFWLPTTSNFKTPTTAHSVWHSPRSVVYSIHPGVSVYRIGSLSIIHLFSMAARVCFLNFSTWFVLRKSQDLLPQIMK